MSEKKIGVRPAPAPDTESLPMPLTFFVTAGERTLVLRALRRHGPDRRAALLRALRVAGPPPAPARSR